MPFDWYHSKIPTQLIKTFPEKTVDMRLDEIKFRARLMRNLGYDSEFIKLRIKGNIMWAHEMTAVPDYIDMVDEVVDKIFLK